MFKIEYRDSIRARLIRLSVVGVGVTMLGTIACGPITAQDVRQIVDTGREIQRLQQTEILPRVSEIEDLQFEEIEPRRLRLEEIYRQIRDVEQEKLFPVREQFRNSDGGDDQFFEFESETRTKFKELEELQREFQHEARQLDEQFREDTRELQEYYVDLISAKEDGRRELDGDSHDLRSMEKRAMEYHDAILEMFGKLDRLEPDSEKAKILLEEIEELQEKEQRFYYEIENGKRDADETRFAIEDELQTLFREQEDAMRQLHSEFRILTDDLEARQMELQDKRWALEEEAQERRDSVRTQLQDNASKLKDQLSSVVENEIGPLRDEALAIEEELQKLLNLERGIQSELRELTGEIAPRQFEMESSLLDILDKALSAASDGGIISADDGAQ